MKKSMCDKRMSFRLILRRTVFKCSIRFFVEDPISKKKELIQDAITIERNAKILLLVWSKYDKGIALQR